MQCLVSALRADNPIQPVVQGLDFLVRFLQKFLAIRLIILLSITIT